MKGSSIVHAPCKHHSVIIYNYSLPLSIEKSICWQSVIKRETQCVYNMRSSENGANTQEHSQVGVLSTEHKLGL